MRFRVEIVETTRYVYDVETTSELAAFGVQKRLAQSLRGGHDPALALAERVSDGWSLGRIRRLDPSSAGGYHQEPLPDVGIEVRTGGPA